MAPSLSDLFFVFVIGWMFLTTPGGWERLLTDSDTALHLRIGQHILATRSVPAHDLFAFSKVGQPWYAFEWLSEATFAAARDFAGFKGVVLLAGVVIGLYLTVLLKYCLWKGANGTIALVAVLLTASATTIHFHARPHLFTLLFLAISVWMMDAYRRSGTPWIWLLVPLTVLWANLHGGFFIFFALLGLRFVGCAAEAYFWPEIRTERRREAMQLLYLGAACTAASLINPYGYRLHLHIVETLRSPWIMSHISEFLSPSFRSEPLFDFMFMLFAGIASITTLVRQRKLVEPLWILFLAYSSLVSVRHSTLFMLVAAPIIACELSSWWGNVCAGKSKTSVAGMLDDFAQLLSAKLQGTSLFIPVAIVVLAVVPGIHWPTDFPRDAVPAAMVDAHADLLATGRVFASDATADYLIYRNYPRQRVFIDSRHNYYGEKIGNDYVAIANGSSDWRKLLDEYGFNVALCDADQPLVALLQMDKEWRLLDKDAKYVLFAREK